MTPNEYRKKHKRCATCEYCHEVNFYPENVGKCSAKQKYISTKSGRFCRVYKPEMIESEGNK